jgi:hypothetical protein
VASLAQRLSAIGAFLAVFALACWTIVEKLK